MTICRTLYKTSLPGNLPANVHPAGQQEISLTLHPDNEDYPEVAITLYRHDGTQCLAAVDGKSVAYIPRSEAVELMEVIRTIVL